VTPKSVAQGPQHDFGAHVIEAHTEILEALEARDADRAAVLMTEHIREAAGMVENMEIAFDRALIDQSMAASLDLAGAVAGMRGASPLPPVDRT
jgi:ribosomal protein L1